MFTPPLVRSLASGAPLSSFVTMGWLRPFRALAVRMGPITVGNSGLRQRRSLWLKAMGKCSQTFDKPHGYWDRRQFVAGCGSMLEVSTTSGCHGPGL
jgi:hypothetical protein